MVYRQGTFTAGERNSFLKVLHLSTYDIRGGAARAAYRIHTALREQGVDSSMLVAQKESDDVSVLRHPVLWRKNKNEFVSKLLGVLQVSTNPTLHSASIFPSGICHVINRSDAEVVHLHWICGELISVSEVSRIQKPIVWTLHDMWAFCGAEHCDTLENPGRYRDGYSRTNCPKTHGGRFDMDAWVWRRKQKRWKNVEFNFVTPSNWLASCLRESALFRGQEVSVIPHSLNTEIFRLYDKVAARNRFGICLNKRIMLFGADGGGKNYLKGFHLLKEALFHLSKQPIAKNLACVVFGGKNKDMISKIGGISVMEIGRIEDDALLAMLYSAADVFITPSLMEAFGQTVSESMACGTPCVGFGTSGIPDLIDHQRTGFLATPFDTREMANGIEWVLEDEKKRQLIGMAAREKVLGHYSNKKIAEKYSDHYQKVVKKHQSRG